MTTIIDLRAATAYEADSYGITARSSYVYLITGKGLHNRNSPHRITVWDNTVRPNPHPGQTRWTEFGQIGGDGQYLDPNNKGTDEPVSVTTSAEATVITAHGANTGTEASGQVYADETLTVGETVRLRHPDGTLSGPYVVTTRPLADPDLVPVRA